MKNKIVLIIIVLILCFIIGMALFFIYDRNQIIVETNAEIAERNENKIEEVIIEPDTISPEIILQGEELINLNKLSDYVEPGFYALDDRDGNLTEKVKVSNIMKDQNEKGSYYIEYTVSDNAGNTATKIRKIAKKYVGTVCLTFDDGPSELTPEYINELNKREAKATFFVVGFPTDNSYSIEVLKRAFNSGHTIGLHGNSHNYSKIYSSTANIVNNFNEEKDAIKTILAIEPKFIRFPGGSSNTVSRKYCKGVITDSAKILSDEGFIYYDWNVDSNDAGADVNSSEAIYKNVVNKVKPGKTSIVLMHDSGNHKSTLEALPKILDELIAQGYDLEAIDEHTDIVQHKIVN